MGPILMCYLFLDQIYSPKMEWNGQIPPINPPEIDTRIFTLVQRVTRGEHDLFGQELSFNMSQSEEWAEGDMW